MTYFTDITKDFVINEKLKSTSIYVLLGKDKYLIVDVSGATNPSFYLLQNAGGYLDYAGTSYPPALLDGPRIKNYSYPEIFILTKITPYH